MKNETRVLNQAPLDIKRRLHELDALRGFALFGILIANIAILSGLVFVSNSELAAMGSIAVNDLIVQFHDIFINQKFYSLFSLLFGIGFALQLQRWNDNDEQFITFFRRRLALLVLIGLLHSFLLWSGDILVLYGLLGFLLVPLRLLSQRNCLIAAIVLLLSPIPIYFIMYLLKIPDPFAAFKTGGEGGVNQFLGQLQQASYIEKSIINAKFVAARWINLFLNIRFPRVLGMFLLGLWLVRSGLLPKVLSNRRVLVYLGLFSGLIGLVLNYRYAELHALHQYLPASLTGLEETVFSVLGAPILCISYCCWIILLSGAVRLTWLELVGRMSLTNYVMQSAMCNVIFFSFGFGYLGTLNRISLMGVVLGLFFFQMLYSRVWLSYFKQGPLESLWRYLSYRSAI